MSVNEKPSHLPWYPQVHKYIPGWIEELFFVCLAVLFNHPSNGSGNVRFARYLQSVLHPSQPGSCYGNSKQLILTLLLSARETKEREDFFLTCLCVILIKGVLCLPGNKGSTESVKIPQNQIYIFVTEFLVWTRNTNVTPWMCSTSFSCGYNTSVIDKWWLTFLFTLWNNSSTCGEPGEG